MAKYQGLPKGRLQPGDKGFEVPDRRPGDTAEPMDVQTLAWREQKLLSSMSRVGHSLRRGQRALSAQSR